MKGKCLGFGDNPGRPGTSGTRKPVETQPGSPRNARAKQVLDEMGREKQGDGFWETEEGLEKEIRRRLKVGAEAGLYMVCEGRRLTWRELAEIEEGKTVEVLMEMKGGRRRGVR